MPPSRPPRVVAVVVTWNRRALLERLLDALDATPGLAEVLVVDNASTDGTHEWLTERAAAPRASASAPVLRHRRLTSNTGGAGGFDVGLRWAMERDAELAWLMDDDGVPQPGCLATLLAHHGALDFWGPAVVAEQAPDRLCFPIRLPGGSRVVHALADVERASEEGLVRDVVIPFNGVLVTRALVERIGSVRAEFFIWGDDVEYLWRARAAGARIATIVAARFHHPATDDLGTPMMGGRTTYNHSPSDLKHFCMARNNTVNLRTYGGWAHVLAFWVKTVWFYSLTRRHRGRIRLSARAAYEGLRGDFTGHRRFLA